MDKLQKSCKREKREHNKSRQRERARKRVWGLLRKQDKILVNILCQRTIARAKVRIKTKTITKPQTRMKIRKSKQNFCKANKSKIENNN